MRETTQKTLDGADSDGRVVPDTLLWCSECENNVLRANKDTHPHETQSERPLPHEDDDNELSEDCLISTRTWEVTFYYETRETVRVEAAHNTEAKRLAREKRELRGGFVQETHDESRELSDGSQATIDYLEQHGLLPQDHDVTQEDIERINVRYDDD
jgi:hypothetical protein